MGNGCSDVMTRASLRYLARSLRIHRLVFVRQRIELLGFIIEQWRQEYNHRRSYSSLGSLAPAAFAE